MTDGRGGSVSERIQLRVVQEGVAGSGSLRFVEPPGAGMAVDLTQTPCVDNLGVEIKADLIAADDVLIDIAPPKPDRVTLSPAGPGKTKRFNWCPTDEQLDRSLTHTITFTAQETGGEAPINKRFLIRFKRNAGAGCAGEPPQIRHQSPGSVEGQLNYELTATITDDVGFKSPPVLAFTVDPENDPRETAVPDTSGWQLVEMTRDNEETWRASVPNLGLADGVEAEVFYVIIATDDDDTMGTRCDHTSESPVFMMTARGGGNGGQTYGYCDTCVSDAQCGDGSDLCVSLGGDSFCGVDCTDRDCGAGQSCIQFTSVDGTMGFQCVPADFNCGQRCDPDQYDAAGGNDTVANATPIDAGTFENLSACRGDADFYTVGVAQGESITARIIFDNNQGDLDIGMAMPGDSTEMFPYVSASSDQDVEEVSEPCVPTGGQVTILAAPYNEAEAPYRLEVEVGPGECDVMCADDGYDEGQGNDSADDFAALDLPFNERALQVCRGDEDFYGFVADAGQVIRINANFVHDDGNLDLNLFRSNGLLIGTAVGFRDTEIIEVEAPTDDIYVLAVFGATPSVSNRYDLEINTAQAMMCESTTSCPVGTYCGNAGCVDAACAGFDECQNGHACVAGRAGLDPAAGGGSCVDFCDSNLDCRDGYACKRFEDFTMACSPAGAAETGVRCAGSLDCAADLVCFAVSGGYCAAGGCAGDLPCPVGTVCGELAGFPACLKGCAGDGDCRVGEGYSCQDVGGGNFGCAP